MLTIIVNRSPGGLRRERRRRSWAKGRLVAAAVFAFVGPLLSLPPLARAAPPVMPPQPAAAQPPASAVAEPLPNSRETATTAPPSATALPVPTTESAVSAGPAVTGTAASDVTAPLPTPAVPAAPAPFASTVELGDGVRRADTPIFEKWWFWTAIAAVAVTAVVIVATSSGPSAPSTELGNMTAF